jgi:hypothetical protein
MTAKKKKTAKQVVAENLASLQSMSCAELTAFGKSAGFDSASGFGSFKRALAAAGVDYDALRLAAREAKAEAREAACSHEVTLYSDAKARTGRFAIFDSAGEPVWFGRFFDDDSDFSGEQSTGEMSAAKKAVWLARQVANAIGCQAIRLRLLVDAEWLTWANGTDPDRGGKAKALRVAAERANVVLRIEHVAGTANPADKYTVAGGYKRWQDNDLAALAQPIEWAGKPEGEAAEDSAE